MIFVIISMALMNIFDKDGGEYCGMVKKLRQNLSCTYIFIFISSNFSVDRPVFQQFQIPCCMGWIYLEMVRRMF